MFPSWIFLLFLHLSVAVFKGFFLRLTDLASWQSRTRRLQPSRFMSILIVALSCHTGHLPPFLEFQLSIPNLKRLLRLVTIYNQWHSILNIAYSGAIWKRIWNSITHNTKPPLSSQSSKGDGEENLEMVGWICRSRVWPQLSGRWLPLTFASSPLSAWSVMVWVMQLCSAWRLENNCNKWYLYKSGGGSLTICLLGKWLS